MDPQKQHPDGYSTLIKNIVITAAAGVEIKYDASIRHYRYALHDVKTENMLRYFDDAAEKIDKGMITCLCRDQVGQCVGALWGWGLQGNFIIYSLVCYLSHCLSH